MNSLKSKLVNLRALEPEDLDFLYDIENNEANWLNSGTVKPYTKFALKQYLENSHLDICEIKQVRFMIENHKSEKIGLVDLFDFDPQNLRAGIGIIIAPKYRQNGYAYKALQQVHQYAFNFLNLKQIYANIITDNHESIHLFEKLNYSKSGIRKNWIRHKSNYKDVAFYQFFDH